MTREELLGDLLGLATKSCLRTVKSDGRHDLQEFREAAEETAQDVEKWIWRREMAEVRRIEKEAY